jgi:hypothetical protein
MPAFPTKQIPVEIYLTLKYNAERHKVLVLTHAILPLEEDLESSLTLFFKFLINDRGISSGKQASILREKLFNSLVVHGTSLVSCGVVQGSPAENPPSIRIRIKTEGLSAEVSSGTLH